MSEEFNRDEYEIHEEEIIVKKTVYSIYRNGKKDHYLTSENKSEVENELNLMEAFAKVQKLPYCNEYYYCETKDELMDYARFMSFKCPIITYIHNIYKPDNHYIEDIDKIWTGPDWYKLTISDTEDERYYHVYTFVNYKKQLENKLNAFTEALKKQKESS